MPNCGLCGEPMPEGEEMFNYHGFSGPCPKPVKPKDTAQQLASLIMEADLPKLLEAESARMRLTLQAVKSLVVGDKNPLWEDDWAITGTRGQIADLCDVALGNVKPDC